MKVQVSRDSVCAGDDIDSHDRSIDVADALDRRALVLKVMAAYPLPRIAGGKATWCLASKVPLGVWAQQWEAPRVLRPDRAVTDGCAVVDGSIQLHFSYFAQIDPALVIDVLERLRLTNDRP